MRKQGVDIALVVLTIDETKKLVDKVSSVLIR